MAIYPPRPIGPPHLGRPPALPAPPIRRQGQQQGGSPGWSDCHGRDCRAYLTALKHGVALGAALVALAWFLVSGYGRYRARQSYVSPTGLLVVQLRRQDGTISPFWGSGGARLGDLRAPLPSAAGIDRQGLAACVDYAGDRDPRMPRPGRRRSIYSDPGMP